MNRGRNRASSHGRIKSRPVSAFQSIELKATQRRYETGLLALDGVDLKVARGELVSVVGPAGCGRSSLLRLLAGLDKPSAGEVLRNGEPSRGALSDVGMVFQEPTLMSWASVATNVELPLRLQGVGADKREQAARDALQRVGLAEQADAAPRSLDRVQKMRAALARALVAKPALLLLDDPFSGFDSDTRQTLQNLMLQLWRPEGSSSAKFAAVLVTNQVEEAVALGQRVIVMAERPGRVIEDIKLSSTLRREPDFRHSSAFQKACEKVRASLAKVLPETVAG